MEEEPQGSRTPQESLKNQQPIGPAREHGTDLSVVQLGRPVELLKWEQGLSLTTFPAFGSLSPNWAALSNLS